MMELNGTGHNDDIEHRISDYDNLSGYIHYILTNKQEIIQKAQYIRPTREISRSLYLASRGMHDMWFADVMQHSSATEPIETPVLYAAYVDWAMSYGTIPITADHFFNVLKYRGWRVHVVQDVDGRRQEAVLGCTLDMPNNTPLDKFRDWLEITFRDKYNVPYIEIESAWRNTKHLYPTISNLKQCLVSYGIHNDIIPHIRGIGKHSQPDTQETL
ncbi:MAG: hypothetical protein F4Z07_06165 [Dehalococcoidia bacterium]|nr:hypothetical protein [Dehalococcoidia bacterium]